MFEQKSKVGQADCLAKTGHSWQDSVNCQARLGFYNMHNSPKTPRPSVVLVRDACIAGRNLLKGDLVGN